MGGMWCRPIAPQLLNIFSTQFNQKRWLSWQGFDRLCPSRCSPHHFRKNGPMIPLPREFIPTIIFCSCNCISTIVLGLSGAQIAKILFISQSIEWKTSLITTDDFLQKMIIGFFRFLIQLTSVWRFKWSPGFSSPVNWIFQAFRDIWFVTIRCNSVVTMFCSCPTITNGSIWMISHPFGCFQLRSKCQHVICFHFCYWPRLFQFMNDFPSYCLRWLIMLPKLIAKRAKCLYV